MNTTTTSQEAPPTADGAKSNIFVDHWDKILTIIIAGVVGFFSAVAITKAEISRLNERIVEIETKYEVSVEPKLLTLEQNLREMVLVKEKMEILELKDSTANLINKQLEERLKVLRIETLKELNDLIGKKK